VKREGKMAEEGGREMQRKNDWRDQKEENEQDE
jgi:hypothetical protein